MEIVKRDSVKADNASSEEVTPVDKATVESTSPFVEVVELPSLFKPYPSGTRISFKPYSFGEIEDWSTASRGSFRKKIEMGLAGIETVGIDKMDLDYQDYLYIMVLRKLSTFSSTTFIIRYTCPKCGEYVELHPNISDIEFEDIESIVDLPLDITLSDGTELTLNTLTVRDALFLEENELSDSTAANFAVKIKNMEYQVAYDLLRNMTNGDDMDVLDVLAKELDFGTQKAELVCPKCEKPSQITVNGIAKLAEPFRRTKESILNSIIASQKSRSKRN